MPRIFNRVITFHVEGEIYDHETTPESIIKNYNWSIRNDMDGKVQLVASHKDKRGRITKIVHLPKVHQWHTPDTELFLI